MSKIDKILYEVKNSFFLGKFSKCISLSAEIEADEDEVVRVNRIYESLSRINLGEFSFVQSELKDSEEQIFQVILTFSEYLSTKDQETKKKCVEKFSEWLIDPILKSDSHFLVVASKLFTHENNFKKALQCVHRGTTLEMYNALIVLLIKIHRVELAEKKMKEMKEMDDLATLTQLTEVFVSLAVGGKEKLSHAQKTLTHLSEKHGNSTVLLNCQAVAFMMTGNFELAEKKLIKSIGMNSKDEETLTNLIVCQTNLKKPKKIIDRYKKQVEELTGNKWIEDVKKKEAEFDDLVK